MNILFIHQNFPGQFKFLAPALVKQGHKVVGMTMQKTESREWQGVRIVPYHNSRGTTPNIHPWVSDFETKVIRGESCYRTAIKMKEAGFNPDVIIAHHGWGESLFLKEVWPRSRMGIYCEFFYRAHGADAGFDPEFPSRNTDISCSLPLRNLTSLLHFDMAEAGLSPTHWQASTFPEEFRSRMTVVHDGIDTRAIAPNLGVGLTLNGTLNLTRKDEVITFVNRNLEPYRGYHIFMRALPDILKRRPHARILIVGGDDVSYGSRPTVEEHGGQKWKDIFISEVRPQISATDWGRVHFLGNIPYNYFIPLLQLSTVHVYLTYPLFLSWSLCEAMSAGCAIVASDTQPLHEAIKHDETGRLVNFFDTEGLANEVCALLEDQSLRQRLGKNAREFAISNYDLNTVCLPRQLGWVNSIHNV
jgi:glycosyltransferase involved in cell wall biosynthesis